MTLPTYVGTIPDGTALQVLSWINNSFLALYSKCLSPTPPDSPVAGMEWINSGTGVVSVRDPQGVAWVPTGKFEGQSWIPFVATGGSTGGSTGGGGDSSLLGPYASLAAGTGFAGGANGEVFVRRIIASDLPTLTTSTAGIAPAPTANQAGAVLRPSGWSPLYQDLGAKSFAGQTAYVWSGFQPPVVLRGVWQITMPGTRVGVVQLGSGGAPKTSGYNSSLAAPPFNDAIATGTDYFAMWYDAWDLPTVALHGWFEVTDMGGNTYHFASTALASNSRFVHTQIGTVTLSGPLNYLRITTSGATPVAITSGKARILAG